MSSESILKAVALVNAQGETVQGDVAVQGKLLAFYFAVRIVYSQCGFAECVVHEADILFRARLL